MTDHCRQGSSQGGSAATRRGAQSEPHVSRAQEEGCSSWRPPAVSRSVSWQVCWRGWRGWLQRVVGASPHPARHHFPADPRLPRLLKAARVSDHEMAKISLPFHFNSAAADTSFAFSAYLRHLITRWLSVSMSANQKASLLLTNEKWSLTSATQAQSLRSVSLSRPRGCLLSQAPLERAQDHAAQEEGGRRWGAIN